MPVFQAVGISSSLFTRLKVRGIEMPSDIRNDDEKAAYEKGYRIIDGEVYNPSGVKLNPTSTSPSGYIRFSVSRGRRNRVGVFIHQLVAYQKYGDKVYESGIQVRHLDGNRLNNCESNILLGTQSDNMMDIPSDDRKAYSVHAASHLRKFTDQEVKEIREFHRQGNPYSVVMVKYNISSKGSLHYILNVEYQTSK